MSKFDWNDNGSSDAFDRFMDMNAMNDASGSNDRMTDDDFVDHDDDTDAGFWDDADDDGQTSGYTAYTPAHAKKQVAAATSRKKTSSCNSYIFIFTFIFVFLLLVFVVLSSSSNDFLRGSLLLVLVAGGYHLLKKVNNG